jgi:hypothetical protein
MLNINDCKFIQKQIIETEPKNLLSVMNKNIETHMESCTNCQQFYRSLISSYMEIKLESFHIPEPHPSVKQKLINNLTNHSNNQTYNLTDQWKKLLNWFFKPIPVYQAAMTVILVIILMNINWPLKNNPSTMDQSPQTPPKEILSSDIYHLSNLEILKEQNIGINACEDTVLSNFLFISM